MRGLDRRDSNIIHLTARRPNLNLIYSICDDDPDLIVGIDDSMHIPYYYAPNVYLTSKKLINGLTTIALKDLFSPNYTKNKHRASYVENSSIFDESPNVELQMSAIRRVSNPNKVDCGKNKFGTLRPEIEQNTPLQRISSRISFYNISETNVQELRMDSLREKGTGMNTIHKYYNLAERYCDSEMTKFNKFCNTLVEEDSLRSSVFKYLGIMRYKAAIEASKNAKTSIPTQRHVKLKFLTHLNTNKFQEKLNQELLSERVLRVASERKSLFWIGLTLDVIRLAPNSPSLKNEQIKRVFEITKSLSKGSDPVMISRRFILDQYL